MKKIVLILSIFLILTSIALALTIHSLKQENFSKINKTTIKNTFYYNQQSIYIGDNTYIFIK